MSEEVWGFVLVSMISAGSVSDADLQPHIIGKFQTQKTCEDAGKQIAEKSLLFAKTIKKDLKVRADFICLPQGEANK